MYIKGFSNFLNIMENFLLFFSADVVWTQMESFFNTSHARETLLLRNARALVHAQMTKDIRRSTSDAHAILGNQVKHI